MKSGFIQTSFGYCDWSFEEEYVHTYNLFVLPEFRRQGRAKAILKQSIKEIRGTGYTGRISIVAEPKGNSISAEKLILFYKKMGLEVYEY